MSKTTKPTRAILIPGNGVDEGEPLDDVLFYGWIRDELSKPPFNIKMELKPFPDPLYAREHIWKAFAKEQLGLDANTLIIGHSSGAACSLRLMEEVKSAGCILVSAYDSDLGDKIERESGYFSRPFDFEKMKGNTPFILQFHSRNDHLVPVACARRVAAGLGLGEGKDYIERERDGHFQNESHPIILETLKQKLAEMGALQ